MTGVDQRTILNHYNISTLNPLEWPAEKDESDDDEREGGPVPKRLSTKAKSRYTVLERIGSERRSLVPGSEKTRDGVENLVQRDESDPLGATDSVVRSLLSKGLPVDKDERLRNRFLLSSTTFQPASYLSHVHSNTSTQQLLHGLEYLSKSIDQKSASLKDLVESNFDRFVKAKSTIDNVYTEMRNQGAEPPFEQPRTHSRHASRNSLHFRSGSGAQANTGRAGLLVQANEKRKHALIKESEYGVQGIKVPLIEVAVKAEEVWGPALGGREREQHLKAVLDSVEKSKGILQLSATISDAIKRKDYDGLVKDYAKARKAVDEAQTIANNAGSRGGSLTEAQVHQLVMTARVWINIEEQIEQFKRGIWRSLTSVEANLTMSTDKSHRQDHVALISVLLELGVEDNPIWVWLLSRYDYLKNKINSTFERSRVEIEVLRRRLANAEKPSLSVASIHLKSPANPNYEDRLKNLDTAPVLELWDLVILNLTNLLSSRDGVLGEIIDFWDKAQSFIDDKAQRTLPTGIDGISRKHHRLSSDGVRDLEKGAVELVEILRDHIFSFFADPPIEDISLLFSPQPDNSPTPQSATLSPFSRHENRFNVDLLAPPPLSSRKGEPWEDFAFWPPYANSVGGVHYLGRLLVLLGNATSELASLRPIQGTGIVERLKTLLNMTRDRSVRAICLAWVHDAQISRVLEDSIRPMDRRDITRMPFYVGALESFILSGSQKILYIPDVVSKRGASDTVTAPASKLCQMITAGFVDSFFKVLHGMTQDAKDPIKLDADARSKETNLLLVKETKKISFSGTQEAPEISNSNVLLLLILSNLRSLRTSIIPSLISQFETDFSIKLVDDSKTIYEAVAKCDSDIFTRYTRPLTEKLVNTIHNGISSPDWAPTTAHPTSIRPYVYTCLLLLVQVHTEVSTTASPLTMTILQHLLEQISRALLDSFKVRGKYNLAALMQATLDVEFIAQTLNQYQTETVSKLQSQIYLELDKGTDNSARAKLQSELPVMKSMLKRLRESTRSEFACFKKVKTERAAK